MPPSLHYTTVIALTITSLLRIER